MKKVIPLVLSMLLTVSTLSLTSFAAFEEEANVQTAYSYIDLVNMVTDLENISLLPQKGEVSSEASSWSRKSKYDPENDQYIAWDDNADWDGKIGDITDDRGHGIIAADLKRPGVIFRSWSANAQSGLIDIYIDGELYNTNLTYDNFFKPIDAFKGLDAMCYITPAQGRNNFVPISYNESCKIVLRDNWGSYYQFTYTQFPEGTTVESMPKTFSDEQKAALKETNRKMKELGEEPSPVAGQIETADNFIIAPGTSEAVYESAGEGAITQFKVKINKEMDEHEVWQAVQDLTISIYWDGKDSPDVWAPLGDFFGSPCGDAYTTLPIGYLEDGWFYSYWYMPYAAGAKISIGNDGAIDRDISIEVVAAPLQQDIDRYGRFHAKWNKDQKQPDRPDLRPDYTVLKTEGAGRFLGFSLHVYEKGNFGWWGEGDEKFFVDGEKFPSSFGTGSEDYFGYAWCGPTIFGDKAFHAQNHNEGEIGNVGNKVNMRVQIADNTPFQTEFAAYIEKYHSQEMSEYSVTPFWYLSPDGKDDYEPVTELAERTSYYKMPIQLPETVIEAEKSTIAISAGTGWVQGMNDTYSLFGGWSNGSQYLWMNNTLGSDATFTFNLRKDVSGELKIAATKSFDFGMFQFYLDDEKVGNVIDFYNPFVTPSNSILLGEVTLGKGTHTLKAVAMDKNPKSSNYLLGLDCIIVDPLLRVSNIIEGENMELKSVRGGLVITQNMAIEWPSAGEYSGGKQMWWTQARVHGQTSQQGVNAELELYVDVAEDFEGPISMAFTKASNYGIVQMWLDDTELANSLDLYNPSVTNSGLIGFGNVKLDAGRHVLRVQIIGKNEKSNGYMFAVDSIVLSGFKEDAVILPNVGNLSGKSGTEFNLPVQIRGIPENAAIKSIEGVLNVPLGIEVADVETSFAVPEKVTFDYQLDAAGTLRFAFISTTGEPIALTLNGDTDLATFTFRLAKNFNKGDILKIAAQRLTLKYSDNEAFEYNTASEGTSTAKIFSTGEFSVSPRILYTGDDSDLVPSAKQAVAIEFTGVDGYETVTVAEIPLYYSKEKSDKTGKVTYVGLVDTSIDLAAMSDNASYKIDPSVPTQTLLFGDVDSDGVINAGDALSVLTAWLRRTTLPNPLGDGILRANVSSDAKINTTDVIEIVDKYVDNTDFTIIGK